MADVFDGWNGWRMSAISFGTWKPFLAHCLCFRFNRVESSVSSFKKNMADFSLFFPLSLFLDAPSHLYKRWCQSVRPSVRPSPVIFKRVLGASCAVYPALFFFFSSSDVKKKLDVISLSWKVYLSSQLAHLSRSILVFPSQHKILNPLSFPSPFIPFAFRSIPWFRT